jgi:hypothetical protein
MRLFSGSSQGQAQRQIFSDRVDSIDLGGAVVAGFTIILRSPWTAGAAFKAGLGLGLIIDVIVLLISYYALRLVILSAAQMRLPMIGPMCRDAFGSSFGTLVSISCIVVSVLRISVEFDSAIEIAQWRISVISETDLRVLTDTMTLSLIASALLCVLCFSRSLKLATKMAWLSLIFFIAVIVHAVIIFIRHTRNVGFDPSGELLYFQGGSLIALATRQAMLSAGIAPITFPGLRHLRNSTPHRLMTGFGVGLLLGWVMRVTYGLLSYLTHFSSEELLASELAFADLMDVKIFCIVKILVMILSATRSIDLGRYTFCHMFRASDEIPGEVWTAIGVTISLIGAMLVGHGENFRKVIHAVEEILTCCLLFIIPGVLFIKLHARRQQLHTFGAAIAVLAGMFGIACILWATLDEHT